MGDTWVDWAIALAQSSPFGVGSVHRPDGGTIWMDPSTQVVYYSRSSLRKLWKPYFQYGLYKVWAIQKHGAVPSWRHLVPAAFVLALVLSVTLALATGHWVWALVVAGPYLAASLGASLWTARKGGRTLRDGIPVGTLALAQRLARTHSH